jgi:hypothetical protein
VWREGEGGSPSAVSAHLRVGGCSLQYIILSEGGWMGGKSTPHSVVSAYHRRGGYRYILRAIGPRDHGDHPRDHFSRSVLIATTIAAVRLPQSISSSRASEKVSWKQTQTCNYCLVRQVCCNCKFSCTTLHLRPFGNI